MAVPDGYESGNYVSRYLNSEILSQYKYGVACVSNIDVRGNFMVNAIVKRPRKHSKPVYELACILGYIGGEIRDGFFGSNLRESEVISEMKFNIDFIDEKYIRMTFAPVEEVAALCVLPLHKKSVEKGLAFPDRDTANAFQCLKKVAQKCKYKSAEDFWSSILEHSSSRSLNSSKFQGFRAELQTWLLEKEDLMYHGCPLPPRPPQQNPSTPTSFLDFLQQRTQMLLENEQVTSWKKIAAKKITSALNYERFCGMAEYQALWYAWMGDLDRANVMVDALKSLQDDQQKEKPLNPENMVVSIIFDISYCNLVNDGVYEGSNVADARLTPTERCDICLSHAKRTNTASAMDSNLLTCVDRDGTGEFGSSQVRNDLAKLLFAVNKFGIDLTMRCAAEHLFTKAIDTFLAHSFENLFWKIKPTNVMADATKSDFQKCVFQAIASKPQGELDVCKLAESCKSILSDALSKNCGSKLRGDDIIRICGLFETKFQKVVKEYHKLVDEVSSLERNEANLSAEKISQDLFLSHVVPFLAYEFKGVWDFLSGSKKTKILTKESHLVYDSCREAFSRVLETSSGSGSSCLLDKTQAKGESFKSEQGEDKVCSDSSCACKDVDKFHKHLVNILSSANNPVPFFKCNSSGDVVISEELCSASGKDHYNGMPAFDYEGICRTIKGIHEKEFAVCPVLAMMCNTACRRIYLNFTGKLTNDMLELMLKKNPRFEHHSCQTCGQKESQLGEFKKCGGCKSVYYCGKKCQALDWKSGHRLKCKTAGAARVS